MNEPKIRVRLSRYFLEYLEATSLGRRESAEEHGYGKAGESLVSKIAASRAYRDSLGDSTSRIVVELTYEELVVLKALAGALEARGTEGLGAPSARERVAALSDRNAGIGLRRQLERITTLALERQEPTLLEALQEWSDAHGFGEVDVAEPDSGRRWYYPGAMRLEPDEAEALIEIAKRYDATVTVSLCADEGSVRT